MIRNYLKVKETTSKLGQITHKYQKTNIEKFCTRAVITEKTTRLSEKIFLARNDQKLSQSQGNNIQTWFNYPKVPKNERWNFVFGLVTTAQMPEFD